MFYLSSFINNIVNQLIRNLDLPVRITISAVLIIVALFSMLKLVKSIPKDLDLKKPKMKYGWLVLALVCMFVSVLYIVL